MNIPRGWFIVLLVAFVVSIAINVLLLGWLAGVRAGEPLRVGRGAAQQLARTLPEAMRDGLRQELRERARPLARQLRASRNARRELVELLQQPELDRPRIEAQFLQVREHTAAAQQLLQEALVEVAVKTDAQTRQQWLARRWTAADERRSPLAGLLADTEDPAP